MVRIYKRKTDRGKYGGEKLKSALNALKDQPLKQVSRQYGIPARTLRRHRDLKVKYSGVVVLGPKQPVLSHDVERLLIQHITHMERSLYGLSTVDVRRLAFELAERLGIKHNFKSESKMAGRDWLQGFFGRHPDIAIRITGQSTDVPAVAGKSTDAPAVAGTSNEVPTVSGQSTHVTLVAGQSAATNMFATSPDTRPLSCQSAEQIIEELSPRPKLSHRRPRTRVAESAEVLTSSPYKSRLVEIAEKKTKKTVKELRPAKMITMGKGQSSGKGKGKAKPRPRKKQRCEMSSSEDEEWPCLICGEPFENSRPREVWVQCHDCKKWAHRDCTEGQDCFICPNCDSDSD
ncbi:uncharacterized protein LOC121367590 [Gigantopelta aegis]|uniref:uncharacterized protein LOC121367590 n=1 Tax=Gigantopelta aegis TaxID=1735272 RepID=UPI001B88D932|nr:uncharacterized protein LOC121367590 [Gigantopelta aegis]